MAKSTWPGMMIILFSALAFQCTESIPANEPVSVTFNVDIDPALTADLPEDVELILSAVSLTGEPIFDSEMLPLQKNNDGYTTEPIRTKSTNLIITECLIATEDGDILFAIPAPQSPMASRTSFVLGQQLTVINGNEGVLVMLPVMTHQLRDFGLHTFRHETSFNVLVTKPGSNRALSATAWILQGNDTLRRIALQPKMNKITFTGVAAATYTLVVEKGAYKTYRQIFTTANISRKTLRIILEPALTITARGISDTSFPPLMFYLGGTSGHVTVDWGDGSNETKALTEYQTEFSHYYAVAGSYPVEISGDLSQINYFYSFYGDGEFSDIRFDHLINLTEIRYGLTACPAEINLSRNGNLAFAMMPALLNLETLHLPQRHQLSYLDIDGANHLATADIDAIIENLYANTVRENITGGMLSLALNWYQDESDISMVGPPSAAALAKLDLLRDNYGWRIRPRSAPVTTQFFTEREVMRQRAPKHIRHALEGMW